MVILAGEFLRECKPFVEDGVHPQNIIKSFRQAGAYTRPLYSST